MYFKFRNRKVLTLIVFGFFVHALVLKAAFDIYFSSPIDNGMTPVKSTKNPPAKRLVLFVADGLRAEAMYSKGVTNNTPFLTNVRKTRGSWGISHTRVPTESRPGHVAMLAGIYEDPSAILSGWQKNPVYFDSVINQSTNAWCWGSPDIVNMFNKDNLPHIHTHTYDANDEDFGKKNTSVLDLWVFEKVENFLKRLEGCKYCDDLKQSGNLFFLHLLGIDTAGHGFKPESFQYNENIKIVDENVEKMEELFERVFPDKSTAYIFTADHGMTNWGSHGSGSDHETQTPIIAWGAGIKMEDVSKDVKQVDIATLISCLIGINIPINSLGILPTEYINAPVKELGKMLISNVRQLLETFIVKMNRRMFNAVFFEAYEDVGSDVLEQRMNFIFSLHKSGHFSHLKNECIGFMNFLIRGADYYHNYYQLPVLIAITIGLVAWIIYLGIYNVYVPPYKERACKKITDQLESFIFIPIYVMTIILLNVQFLPLMYYVYFLFPITMIEVLFRKCSYLTQALKQLKNFGFYKSIVIITLFLTGLRALVEGFHQRQIYGCLMTVMVLYIFCSRKLRSLTTRTQKLFWVFCCLLASIFPYMPVMKTNFNIYTYLSGYILWCLCLEKLIFNQMKYPGDEPTASQIISVQHNFFKIIPIYTLSVEFDIIKSDSYLKYIAWFLAFYPVFLIPCSSTQIIIRLTSVFIGFAPFYLMVSSNFEMLFMVLYCLILYIWLIIESKFCDADVFSMKFTQEHVTDKTVTLADFRRAFFFVTMIFLGFFGTGNIASLNSFDPMWVRCFLTVFSPFRMAALIVLKVMVPMIFASCAFRGLNVIRKGETLNMFCIVLMFSDIMLLELLYNITNIGSWLEIGVSLSHFIIMESFVLIMLVLYGLAYLITTISYSVPSNRMLFYWSP